MKIKTDLHLIELEDDNFHLVLKAMFADAHPGNWIIDSGASKTVFDLNLTNLYSSAGDETDQVHTAGISEKPIHTTIGWLKEFAIGKLVVTDYRVALLDLSHINRFYSQAAGLQVCGLLGSDFLLAHNAVVDYKRKTLILET